MFRQHIYLAFSIASTCTWSYTQLDFLVPICRRTYMKTVNGPTYTRKQIFERPSNWSFLYIILNSAQLNVSKLFLYNQRYKFIK